MKVKKNIWYNQKENIQRQLHKKNIKDLLKDSLLVLSFPGNNFTPLDLSSPELFTGREQ